MGRKRILVAMLLLCLALPAKAAGKVSVTAPNEVQPGQSYCVTITVPGECYEQVMFTVSYDRQQMEPVGMEVSPGWEADFSRNTLCLARLPERDGADGWLTISFRVKNLPHGTELVCGFLDGVGKAGETRTELGDFSCTTVVQAPQTPEPVLTGLEISDGVLEPAFHSSITAYTVSVPDSVSRLQIIPRTEEGVLVTVDNPELKPGGMTRITITVTAPAAAARVYTLDVWRGAPLETEPAAASSEQIVTPTKPQMTLQTRPGVGEADGVPAWVVAVALLAGCTLGAGAGLLLDRKKK